MMMNNAPLAPPQQQPYYAFELNEHDVLCGRGSGPNDRVGNINFRNLVLSRKAEYLAAPTRDAKGRIATAIVDTIRGRGGRFLKKLSPAQAKEAGFKRGVAVYELADEPTVLEKAKQTLRQNRAEFVQQIQNQKEGGGGPGEANAPSGATVAEAVTKANGAKKSNAGNSHGKNSNGGNPKKAQLQENQLPTTLTQQNIRNFSQQQQNQNSSSSMGSLNPIPLCDASIGLDSMQRPNLSARTAAHLNQALFAASSNISSLTNPSVADSINSNNMMSLNSANLNQQGATGSSGIGSGNYSILSMNTAELCAAMGGGVNNPNDMSFNSFEQSTSSAQAIGDLLQEYKSKEEKTMMQQYEQLKAQQQVLQQQQRELTQQGFHPSIPEGEQQLHFQHQQRGGAQQDQNPSNVFASLLRQYDTQEQNINTTQPHGQYMPKSASMTASQQNNQTAHPQQQYEQYQHYQQQQQQQQQQQEQQQPPPPPSHDVRNVTAEKVTSDKNATVITDSFVKRLSAEDQNKLLQQFQQLQNVPQAGQLPSKSIPPKVGGAYLDSSAPLNDSQETRRPSNLKGAERRRRRRSSRFTNSGRTSASSNMRLSNVEPADLNDDSLRLSFLTANQLAQTLDMSSMGTDLGQSGTMDMRQSATTKGNNNLDASMLSLMSMSLSEIAPDGMGNDNDRGGYDSEGGIEKAPTPVAEGSQEDLGLNASVMSLNA